MQPNRLGPSHKKLYQRVPLQGIRQPLKQHCHGLQIGLTCCNILNPEAELTRVQDDFLLEHELSPAQLMPWLPTEAMPGWEGFFELNVSRAVQHSLTFRALDETIKDAFASDQTCDATEPLRGGTATELEATLLKEWTKLRSDG